MEPLLSPGSSYYRSSSAAVQIAVPRAVHTFDGLLRLADAGYGAPSMALARTLIEDVVAAWWLAHTSTDRVVTLLRAHEQSVALMMQGSEFPPAHYLSVTQSLSKLSAEEVARATAQFQIDPNLGARHWTGKSVKRLASNVKSRMRERERDSLDTLLGAPLLLANLITHNSPVSLAVPLTQDRDAAYQTSRQPSRTLLHECLALAYEALGLLGILVIDPEQRPALDRLLDDDRPLFIVLPGGAKPGRNAPCPCGSGKKFKSCHGVPGA